ncbi:hypothetical protein [Psychromonas sp. 14N.309.X.WAT.B.A12]|uniref:hypothetical protein n=1 Tax=unclassified Psychromonas TaxID=2614957 RepID=UPI0025AF275D|nr:hypothetical protein [Psychromonas sp. 14N.309.X.WAT.B.A12]MDN2665045.1 hypothetical protein [Psychromonas sp. 14N.309.X.WAT.B.A12]
MLNEPQKNHFNKLYHGEMGLAKTIWLYAAIINCCLIGFFLIPFNDVIEVALLFFILAYNLIVMSGIWAASEKYKGKYLWIALSKCLLILSYFVWAIGAFTAINWFLIL